MSHEWGRSRLLPPSWLSAHVIAVSSQWVPFPHACARARSPGCHGRRRVEVWSGGRGGGGGRRTCLFSGAVPILSRRAMPQGRACFQALWWCQFRRLLLLLLSRIPVSLFLFGGGDPRFTLRPTGLGPAFCMLEWPPRALRTVMSRDIGGRTSDLNGRFSVRAVRTSD